MGSTSSCTVLFSLSCSCLPRCGTPVALHSSTHSARYFSPWNDAVFDRDLVDLDSTQKLWKRRCHVWRDFCTGSMRRLLRWPRTLRVITEAGLEPQATTVLFPDQTAGSASRTVDELQNRADLGKDASERLVDDLLLEDVSC